MNPAGSKKIEKDRNWGIGKDRKFLSLPTHHFASPKLYDFSISTLIQNDREYLYFSIPVSGNIYLFYPPVYPPNEVVSIFFYPIVYLFHINLNLFLSLSASFVTEDSYLSQSLNLSL